MVSLNRDDRDGRRLKQRENALRLAQVRRLDLRPIKKVAGEQEHIRLVIDCSPRDVLERVRQVGLGQTAVKTPATEMDVGGVIDLHGRRTAWFHTGKRRWNQSGAADQCCHLETSHPERIGEERAKKSKDPVLI